MYIYTHLDIHSHVHSHGYKFSRTFARLHKHAPTHECTCTDGPGTSWGGALELPWSTGSNWLKSTAGSGAVSFFFSFKLFLLRPVPFVNIWWLFDGFGVSAAILVVSIKLSSVKQVQSWSTVGSGRPSPFAYMLWGRRGRCWGRAPLHSRRRCQMHTHHERIVLCTSTT